MNFNDYVGQGFAFYQKKDCVNALKSFKEAEKLNRDNPEVRELIRMLEGEIGLKEQTSQEALNEAIQRAKNMGIEIENVNKVIAEYTGAFNRNQNDASAKSNLATAHYIRGLTFTSKGDHVRAIADYSDAIKYMPNYPLAFNKRGHAHLDNGDFDKAIADYEELIRLNPDYNMAKSSLANAYIERGMSYDKKGDYDRAISDYEKGLKLNPNDNTTRELLEMAKAEKAKH